jgi:phosphate/sulfate permease
MASTNLGCHLTFIAWVLTLPVSIALAGGLYWLLRNFL